MPKWSIIWFVGILSTIQDMTIDPVYVNDMYVFDGLAQGHWNWDIYYDTTFFGIEKSYVPVVVFTAIHMAYLGVIYVKSKKASPAAAK